MKKLILLFFVILTITACSKPLPDEKSSYVGEWGSKEMYLLILSDGSVAYQRLQNGGTTSITASLKEFVGDDFIVGFAFFTTTFDVTEPPHQVDGKWVMTVDGVKLIKNQD
jgi:hypothetical protein